MSIIVPRTCTEVLSESPNPRREPAYGPLDTFRSVPAYVLLGDPGSGKSTAFQVEAKALGQGAVLMSTREFLRSYATRGNDWWDKTLFIDGLDEMRAGSGDPRAVMDRVWAALDTLGRPRFRISCREADWLGSNDRTALTSVSPRADVKTLRLNPLSEGNIAEILNDHPHVLNAGEFIAQARASRVDGLLTNPLTLNLLAGAVGMAGTWPRSRRETFEMACQQMAIEHNEEHSVADQPYLVNELLETASELCAYQLLTNAAGWSLSHHEADADHLCLDDLDHPVPALTHRAVVTKLFRGTGERRLAPAHQHVAEFLGARHLAQLIDEGLPAARILSLITGGDGSVVTALRGLSAWLAVYCPLVRERLMDRDPVGVGLYGDLQEFSTDEKRRLIMRLDREVSEYGINASAFASLATSDMESVLSDFLTDEYRDSDHQSVTAFLLRVLRHAQPLQGLSQVLLEAVYDDTRWSWVSQCALVAFIHTSADCPDQEGKLRQLLRDIGDGRVSDPDNELLGVLLASLYPLEIPPSEIWHYLSEGRKSRLIGAFHLFWGRTILDRSTDEYVAKLMDYLHEGLPALRRQIELYSVETLPLKLLARALQTTGDKQNPERLYRWLSATRASSRSAGWLVNDFSDQVRTWLEEHSDAQRAIFLEGLSRCPDDDGFEMCAASVLDCLYGSALPPAFVLWCLDQAVELVGINPRVSNYLLRYAVRLSPRPSNGQALSRQVMMERVIGHEAVGGQLAELFERLDQTASDDESRETERRNTEIDREEKRWLDLIRSQADALRENRADPALLFELGTVYFDVVAFLPAPALAGRDLTDVLADDGLYEAAIAGLRGTVYRSDVPEVEEIISVGTESGMHHLGLPFLAAIDDVDRADPAQLDGLSQCQMQQALAFYYFIPTGRGYDPGWYLRWLKTHPELVADVLVQCATPAVWSDKNASVFANLAYRNDHAQVAGHTSLRLLGLFPLHCESQHLKNLDYLLWAALQYADQAALQAFLEEKLSCDSMDATQRVHWLAAGVVAAPGTYRYPLTTFIGDEEARIRELARFFCADEALPFLTNSLDASSLQVLINLLGRVFGPPILEEGFVTPVMFAATHIRQMVDRLSVLPDVEATGALRELADDESLSEWRLFFERSQERQRIHRREAEYRYPTIQEVQRTLRNGAPANTADLAALLLDQLDELALRIRTGNTDDWRQYWNEPRQTLPASPKVENYCRDALLSRLRGLLPSGVDAQPEGEYANDKRADIRVSYGDKFNVPVEVKRDRDPKLWSAVRNQLTARYTVDPDTDGYGIYLVFWFGDGKVRSSPQRGKPSTPQQLQEWLEASLTEPDRSKISVCVVDVSRGS